MERTVKRGRLAALVALAACSGGDGGSGLPAGWTLAAPGIRVEIDRSPYRVRVLDPSGKPVLESLGAGNGDGYGTVGWTSGKLTLRNDFSPGYFRADDELDPWRDDLRVVSAGAASDTALELTLAPAKATTGERVVVSHTLRGSTLRVEARLENGATPRAWSVAFAAPAGEDYLGLGERFTRTHFRGLSIYSWCEEGGIGGPEDEPAGPPDADPWPHGASMSYYPVPFFISTRGYAVWLDTTYYNVVDLAADPRPDAWRAWMGSPRLAYEIYLPIPGDARPWPYHLIDLFTAATGRPMVPPAWAFGPRRRIGHGDRQGDVSEIQAMRDLDLAITSMDDAFHYLPNGTSDATRAALPAAIAEAHRLGYRVNGYYNSFFSNNPADPIAPWTQQGLAQQSFLMQPDGQPVLSWILTGGSTVKLYLLDFTSPAASAWYTGLFRWALDAGHSGWMYDFGEYVPADAVAASGMTGEELHNLYPVLYQKAAFDKLEAGPLRGDWLTFVRSGYTGASQYSPMAWSGDPAASFGATDGLPSMVRAGINIGIAGVPNWGGDIGGFHCLIDGTDKADGELLTRWIEQGALTPSMQDQDACVGGDSSRKASIWSSSDARAAWKTYARLHTRLEPYLMDLSHQAHDSGAPIIRHVFLENPGRADWAGVDDAYYLGPALLVAPVVERGARQKRVDLPPGKWLDWDTRAVIDGGGPVTLDAPLGKLPLLLRERQIVPLLDPRIDTLAPEDNPDVVGPADVADVLDVALLMTRGTTRYTSFDDRWLEATLDGALAPPGLPEAASDDELASCAGCYRFDALAGGAVRVRVTAGGDDAGLVRAGGLSLRAYVGRRVRWDVTVLP